MPRTPRSSPAYLVGRPRRASALVPGLVPVLGSLLLAALPLVAAETPTSGSAATSPPPPPLQGLVSRAEVVGPRGSFVTEMVTLADGRARFVQIHPERRSELLVLDAETAFSHSDPSARSVRFDAAPPGLASFVHGHDVPRLALAAWAASGDREARWPERLEQAIPEALGGGAVTIELGDWRTVIGTTLPFAATFLHGGERYEYRYSQLLPFRLAPGAALPTDPSALFARLGDLGELVAAHERGMAAHRASDAELLVAGQAEEGTVSGRGVLSTSTRAGMLERMRGYLGSIRFTRYVDTAVPVVAVSADGTLGWLACEIDAAGERTVEGRAEPLAYAFSWVELYARPSAPDGPWLAIGNASSQRP